MSLAAWSNTENNRGMPSRFNRARLILLTLALFGCEQGAAPKPTRGVPSSTVGSAEPTTARPKTSVPDLDALVREDRRRILAEAPSKPTDTAALKRDVALVVDAATDVTQSCPWTTRKKGNAITPSLTARPSVTCPALQKWDKLLKEMDDTGRADATLLRMLESTDKTLRYLSARALYRNGGWWANDAASGKRVVAAGTTEKNEHVAYVIGRTIASISPVADMADVVLSILSNKTASAHVAVRRGIADAIMPIYLYNDRLFYEPLVAIATNDTEDATLRRIAISTMRFGHRSQQPQASCSTWSKLMPNNEPLVSVEAIGLLGSTALCSAHWNAMIDELDKRREAGKLVRDYATGLRKFGQFAEATENQKARVAKLVVAADKNAWFY
jgi:hypothetical protein